MDELQQAEELFRNPQLVQEVLNDLQSHIVIARALDDFPRTTTSEGRKLRYQEKKARRNGRGLKLDEPITQEQIEQAKNLIAKRDIRNRLLYNAEMRGILRNQLAKERDAVHERAAARNKRNQGLAIFMHSATLASARRKIESLQDIEHTDPKKLMEELGKLQAATEALKEFMLSEEPSIDDQIADLLDEES